MNGDSFPSMVNIRSSGIEEKKKKSIVDFFLIYIFIFVIMQQILLFIGIVTKRLNSTPKVKIPNTIYPRQLYISSVSEYRYLFFLFIS